MRYGVVLSAVFIWFLVMGGSVSADEAIPFTERNGLKYLTVYINEVPLELVFDTGANNVVLNSEGLLHIGMAEFDDSRKAWSLTAGGVTGSYIVKINSIRAGNIQKRDYDISYIPSAAANLLGASFFAGYSYFIDEDRKMIRLIPKGSYFFDRIEQSEADHHTGGSERFEIEFDGEKYFYEGGRLKRQKQNTPATESSH